MTHTDGFVTRQGHCTTHRLVTLPPSKHLVLMQRCFAYFVPFYMERNVVQHPHFNNPTTWVGLYTCTNATIKIDMSPAQARRVRDSHPEILPDQQLTRQ